MPPKVEALKRVLMVATVAAIAFQTALAQSDNTKVAPAGRASTAVAADANPTASNTPDVARILKAAAEAMGMARWSGVGGRRLPDVDVVNRMEMWGSGTSYAAGQTYKTEYHAALGYNPPAMRLEMTQTNPGGAAPKHTIQVVREEYSWNESEIGAGLEPGRGTATPAMATVKERLLQLWILPYGVVKAAIAAGDKTKVSMENGATVISFPLSGELAGVTVKATLDTENFITKVRTQTDNPALGDAVLEAEYSNYADHGEILTDIKSPGDIVQKQGGHVVLDIQMKKVDANNPYLVFPVPPNVKQAAGQGFGPR